ncbi:hypothetical protein [Sphingomonas xinjiangensis]|uniref:Uncharacterized protein n=1 Tax=Sphingomonas xinjiangensis TaxID=643568 RepID=A0A840YN02_9SPHN|nr:hypothetical protein [Sphingomonas xinjiangensis]MBB5711160.1 hypothetical protein [Sphingomonas xinjiangensis]
MGGANLKCSAAAWVAGWAVAVFLPSLLIALAHMPEGSFTLKRWGADTWQVADTMAPAAKLMLGGVLAILFWSARRLTRDDYEAFMAMSAVAGVVGMALTLLLIPADWAHGFGIGLTGERMAGRLLPLYLMGSGIGGMVQASSLRACRARLG